MISSLGVGSALVKRASSFGDGPDGPMYEPPSWAYIVFLVDFLILLPIFVYVS